MKLKSLTLACFGLAALAAAAYAADAKKPAAAELQLPPGWTAEDMERCIKAGTPGEGQARLMKDVGTWVGKSTVWMAPGMEPINSEVVAEYSPVMDGRYVRCEMSGNCPMMGPFQGLALFGFDNVSKKFVASMVDPGIVLAASIAPAWAFRPSRSTSRPTARGAISVRSTTGRSTSHSPFSGSQPFSRASTSALLTATPRIRKRQQPMDVPCR